MHVYVFVSVCFARAYIIKGGARRRQKRRPYESFIFMRRGSRAVNEGSLHAAPAQRLRLIYHLAALQIDWGHNIYTLFMILFFPVDDGPSPLSDDNLSI